MKRETVEIQKELFLETTSALEKYQRLIIGRTGIWNLLKYELITTMVGWVPGAVGLLLRKRLYPLLVGNAGHNVLFGQNVVLRHPHKIRIGDNVVVDDNVVLDAKGQDNEGISIGDGVFIGRGTILNCKNGDIVLQNHVNLGFNCHIYSASKVELGENALVAANCYLIGGTHRFSRLDISPLEQERESQGIEVRENVWLGSNVQVMDGVTIGHDAIIGTSAVVSEDVPDYSVAIGIPARIVRNRKEEDT